MLRLVCQRMFCSLLYCVSRFHDGIFGVPYTLDEDVFSINFQHYHDTDQNVYTLITMCFGSHKGDSLFKTTGGLNKLAYVIFLY